MIISLLLLLLTQRLGVCTKPALEASVPSNPWTLTAFGCSPQCLQFTPLRPHARHGQLPYCYMRTSTTKQTKLGENGHKSRNLEINGNTILSELSIRE